MAMGSSGVAGKAASAEETSGYGVNSLGDAQHRPSYCGIAKLPGCKKVTKNSHKFGSTKKTFSKKWMPKIGET